MNGMMFFKASRSLERGLSANFTLELQILQADRTNVDRQTTETLGKERERSREDIR